MLELVNLSNYRMDRAMIDQNARVLEEFLAARRLDGVEMLFCEPWDPVLHPKELIHGVHLKYWPDWLDFWLGDEAALLRDFGSKEIYSVYYGGTTREEWLAAYRENILQALAAKPKYLVFHVSQVRRSELFSWRFHYDSESVVNAAVEVLNRLSDFIPDDVALLLENLWWPGLTLRDVELTERLLAGVHRDNIGIMLDTGHLMNTNRRLRSQEEGVAFILHTLERLGACKARIRGIHLHHSLSGAYVTGMLREGRRWEEVSPRATMEHILKIDEHQPFSSPAVQKIVEYARPEFLVHEFTQVSREDWEEKVKIQQRAMGRIKRNS